MGNGVGLERLEPPGWHTECSGPGLWSQAACVWILPPSLPKCVFLCKLLNFLVPPIPYL